MYKIIVSVLVSGSFLLASDPEKLVSASEELDKHLGEVVPGLAPQLTREEFEKNPLIVQDEDEGFSFFSHGGTAGSVGRKRRGSKNKAVSDTDEFDPASPMKVPPVHPLSASDGNLYEKFGSKKKADSDTESGLGKSMSRAGTPVRAPLSPMVADDESQDESKIVSLLDSSDPLPGESKKGSLPSSPSKRSVPSSPSGSPSPRVKGTPVSKMTASVGKAVDAAPKVNSMESTEAKSLLLSNPSPFDVEATPSTAPVIALTSASGSTADLKVADLVQLGIIDEASLELKGTAKTSDESVKGVSKKESVEVEKKMAAPEAGVTASIPESLGTLFVAPSSEPTKETKKAASLPLEPIMPAPSADKAKVVEVPKASVGMPGDIEKDVRALSAMEPALDEVIEEASVPAGAPVVSSAIGATMASKEIIEPAKPGSPRAAAVAVSPEPKKEKKDAGSPVRPASPRPSEAAKGAAPAADALGKLVAATEAGVKVLTAPLILAVPEEAKPVAGTGAPTAIGLEPAPSAAGTGATSVKIEAISALKPESPRPASGPVLPAIEEKIEEKGGPGAAAVVLTKDAVKDPSVESKEEKDGSPAKPVDRDGEPPVSAETGERKELEPSRAKRTGADTGERTAPDLRGAGPVVVPPPVKKAVAARWINAKSIGLGMLVAIAGGVSIAKFIRDRRKSDTAKA